MSDYLAAHPNTSRAAAVGYSEPLDARALEALLALDGLVLPLGLPDQVQFAALLYNSTSIHALPTLVNFDLVPVEEVSEGELMPLSLDFPQRCLLDWGLLRFALLSLTRTAWSGA